MSAWRNQTQVTGIPAEQIAARLQGPLSPDLTKVVQVQSPARSPFPGSRETLQPNPGSKWVGGAFYGPSPSFMGSSIAGTNTTSSTFVDVHMGCSIGWLSRLAALYKPTEGCDNTPLTFMSAWRSAQMQNEMRDYRGVALTCSERATHHAATSHRYHCVTG